MRNMLKATTLERKFPLLAVENGCIISKDADITVAFRVELPELFTVTSAEYEATKQGKEPLKQGQDKPTAKQKEKQEKAQDKSLKADKPKKSRGMKM